MSLLIAAVTAGAMAAPPTAPPIAYDKFRLGRAVFHYVQADIASGKVAARTVAANGLASVWNLVLQSQPSVAITGTFFGPANGYPVGDVLVDGELVAHGQRGSGIGVGWMGNIDIFDTVFKEPFVWDNYRWGLRGAVRLVTDGVVHPNPKAQRFRDRRIWGRAARTGIGLTHAGKLILMATPSEVTLSDFGKAMVAKGVADAISLDGGSSTCLYYKGRLVIPPGRKLSNMFTLSERKDIAAIQ